MPDGQGLNIVREAIIRQDGEGATAVETAVARAETLPVIPTPKTTRLHLSPVAKKLAEELHTQVTQGKNED